MEIVPPREIFNIPVKEVTQTNPPLPKCMACGSNFVDFPFVPHVPLEVFDIPISDPKVRMISGGYDIGGFKCATRSPDGEMLSVFESFPVPRKGIVYSEAVQSNNTVKRLFLSFIASFISKGFLVSAIGFVITPFSLKVKALETVLHNFNRLADSVYDQCARIPTSIRRQYLNNSSKAIWDIGFIFLRELGINFTLAYYASKKLAIMFEFDDAYRIRVIDPLTNFTKEEILKDPRKFLTEYLTILKRRDKNVDSSVSTQAKFEQLIRLLRLALLHPRIKKAFVKALEAISLQHLQLDQYEYFWNLARADYDMQDRSVKDRFDEQLVLIAEHIKKVNNADEVQLTEVAPGRMELRPVFYDKTRDIDTVAQNNPLPSGSPVLAPSN